MKRLLKLTNCITNHLSTIKRNSDSHINSQTVSWKLELVKLQYATPFVGAQSGKAQVCNALNLSYKLIIALELLLVNKGRGFKGQFWFNSLSHFGSEL